MIKSETALVRMDSQTPNGSWVTANAANVTDRLFGMLFQIFMNIQTFSKKFFL